MRTVLTLVILMGFDGQEIEVNPDAIVSTRTPREDTTLSEGVKCTLNTIDGKTISVIETCAEVRRKLGLPPS
jgi:hypothetical protein